MIAFDEAVSSGGIVWENVVGAAVVLAFFIFVWSVLKVMIHYVHKLDVEQHPPERPVSKKRMARMHVIEPDHGRVRVVRRGQ